jgi:hypothetical protein
LSETAGAMTAVSPRGKGRCRKEHRREAKPHARRVRKAGRRQSEASGREIGPGQ